MSTVERIITEITEKRKRGSTGLFGGTQTDVGSAERYFGERITEAVLELLQAYYEKQDEQLRTDKSSTFPVAEAGSL